MNFKFTEVHSGVFMQIFDGESEVATCVLNISKEYEKILSSKKYQITEIPEPVYVLDIPRELMVTVDSKLEQKNGSVVDLISETKPGIVEIKLNNGEYWNILLDWIKQKPTEPTAEEELQEKIGIIEKVASAIYSDTYFTQFLPEKIKRILAGEE